MFVSVFAYLLLYYIGMKSVCLKYINEVKYINEALLMEVTATSSHVQNVDILNSYWILYGSALIKY